MNAQTALALIERVLPIVDPEETTDFPEERYCEQCQQFYTTTSELCPDCGEEMHFINHD